MPQLDDIAKERLNKKFKKTPYRPWDLSGNSAQSNSEEKIELGVTIKTEPVNNVIAIDSETDIPEQISKEIKDGRLKNAIVGLSDNESSDRRQNSRKKSRHDKNINSELFDESENLSFEIKRKIIDLKGPQKKIFYYIVDSCIKNDCLTSGPVSSAFLTAIFGFTKDITKTAISRLENKGLINKDSRFLKKGPGSLLSFNISTEVKSVFCTLIKKR